MAQRPKISVLALGGTIGMAPPSAGAGVVPRLSAADLIKNLPQLADYADISAKTVLNVPSPELTFQNLRDLARQVERMAASGTDGFVICQGTDTIEESAFFLNLVLHLDCPVVFTGAMRHPARPGADGPANILAAVQVAASPAVRGLGVVVVFNDEIHGAACLAKAHTSSVAAFSSAPFGPLGHLCEDVVHIHMRPAHRPALIVPDTMRALRIPIIEIGMDDDGAAIRPDIDTACDALVVRAMGGGHLPSGIADLLARPARAIPCIFASRTQRGHVLTRTYGFAGAERDLIARGLIASGRLNALQARILLTVLLQDSGCTIADVARAFASQI